MILKVLNPDTGGWRMFEANVIEVGEMYLGFFASDPEGPDEFALYEDPEGVMVKTLGKPPRLRAPIRVGAPVDWLFVDDEVTDPIIDMPKTRVKVKVARIKQQEEDDLLIAFSGYPAYLMNNAGKTVEKL